MYQPFSMSAGRPMPLLPDSQDMEYPIGLIQRCAVLNGQAVPDLKALRADCPSLLSAFPGPVAGDVNEKEGVPPLLTHAPR